MAKVIWAPSALDDVERDSVDQAFLFVRRLFKATDRLQEFPLNKKIDP